MLQGLSRLGVVAVLHVATGPRGQVHGSVSFARVGGSDIMPSACLRV